MATIKRATVGTSADGRRIVSVTFTPQVPNPASQADVEVIFEVQKSDMIHLHGDPYAVIGPLSCTLTDTRETYVLSKPQRQAVIQAALTATASADGISW